MRPGDAIYVETSALRAVRWPFPHPSTAAAGLVELDKGNNLTAWGGGSAATLADAVRGIGQSLVAAYVWQPAQRNWCSHRPHRYDTCIVDRGDVLWISVDRDVNWLQPTGEPPQIVFAGEVSSEVRNLADSDLNDAMAFFAEEWGIQADHSRTTIYVAADVVSLANVIPADYGCWSVARTWRDTMAWVCPASSGDGVVHIVLKEERWWKFTRKDERAAAEGRYDLVHEYMHAVQLQLIGDGPDNPLSDQLHPAWLTEGSATWVSGLFYMGDVGRDRDWLRRDNERRLRQPNYGAPNLDSLEQFASPDSHEWGEYTTWAYELGSAAMELLAGSARGGRHENQDSIIEYWRQSVYRAEVQVKNDSDSDCGDEYTNEGAVCVDGLGDDESAPWDLAFERAFSRTIHQFYWAFDEYLFSLFDMPDDAMHDATPD